MSVRQTKIFVILFTGACLIFAGFVGVSKWMELHPDPALIEKAKER
jgi:hypothetical protein